MYTTFILFKENMDTMDAINHLAFNSGIKPNMFGYAGTKDKRAKTSQLVSVAQVAPRTLLYAAKFQRKMQLGNFHYRAIAQKLGQLKGNHFKIVVRDISATDEAVQSAIESLKETGFVNYYGPQRFGTTSIATHVIGRELLKSNWHQAINLILAPRENDIPELNRFRKVWKDTGDASAALNALPRGWEGSAEAQLLSGLSQLAKNDLVGALNKIPRNTRMLYLHAYQSYLWNLVVSRRIEKYGITVLPGDIVRNVKASDTKDDEATTAVNDEEVERDKTEEGESKKKNQEDNTMEGDDDEEEEGKGEEQEESKNPESEGNECEGESGTGEEKEKETEDGADEEGKETGNSAASATGEGSGPGTTWNFRYLSEEEAQTTDITEVVIPLPGYNVEFPLNEIKDWYLELLEADGLTVDSFKHKVKTFAVGGMYRKLIVRPGNVCGTTCYYDDHSLPLVESDMDILRRVDLKKNRLKEGKSKAAIVEMTLPPSSYATVALRELLKMDTSSMFQATLNPPTPIPEDYTKKKNWQRDNKGSWRSRGGRGGWRGGDGGWRGGDRGGWRSGWRGGDRGGWRGGDRGGWRGGGSDRGGVWYQGKRRGDSASSWQQQGGGGYGGGGYERQGGGGGGYDRQGDYSRGRGWGGRGNKRPRGGRDNWTAKRGKYY